MLNRVSSCSPIRALAVGAALLLALLLGHAASAAPIYDYVDVVPIFQPLDGPVSGTFSIIDPGTDCFLLICDRGGFNPDTHNVDAARIDFIFYHPDFSNDEIATIVLGGGLDSAVVDGSDRFMFVFYLEQFEANVGILAQLSDNGTLDWEVIPAGGSAFTASVFDNRYGYDCDKEDKVPFLKVGILKASETPIPEPSAALMFCLGFGVVSTAVRKRRTA